MMKIRGAIVLIAALFMGVACVPEPIGPDAVSSVRPYCPFDSNVVMYGGDSLVTKWPAYINFPAPFERYNTAKGGSMYTRNIKPDPAFGSIGSRVLAELDACGNDIGVVVFSGGSVDLSWGTSAGEVVTAIDALDEELHTRGVTAIFLTITPVSDQTLWFPAHQADRRFINAWMTTPGNLHNTVVDCASAIESSPGSDALALKYTNYTDAFGTIDLVHPNEAGFEAIARCIEPTIFAAVASGDA